MGGNLRLGRGRRHRTRERVRRRGAQGGRRVRADGQRAEPAPTEPHLHRGHRGRAAAGGRAGRREYQELQRLPPRAAWQPGRDQRQPVPGRQPAARQRLVRGQRVPDGHVRADDGRGHPDTVRDHRGQD